MIPRFPDIVDNTMRKELVKCEKAAHYRFELGLQPKEAKKVDLHAGGAFAAGIAAVRYAYYLSRYSAEKSLEIGVNAIYNAYGDFPCPKDSNKSAARMAGALAFYLERCPLKDELLVPYIFPNGRPGIELAFHFPVGVTHPDTGKEVEYGGRFDMLAVNLEDGAIWVVDEKTTSQMGEKWVNQWPLDSQMTGYVWGANKLLADMGVERKVEGAVINGVAIKKYDYDHGRFKTYRPDWMVDRWHTQLVTNLVKWIESYRTGKHDMALDHACAYYNNPCPYAPLCLSRQPEKLFDGSYVVEFWKPGKD